MKLKHITKRYVLPLLIAFCLIYFSKPLVAMANGPQPANSFDLVVTEIPDKAMYVDILIKMDTKDDNYVEFNEMLANAYGIQKNSEIAAYHKDGYISYSFHFIGASSELTLMGEPSRNQFAKNNYDDFNYIYSTSRKIKVALLAEDGAIIKITSAYTLNETKDSYLVAGVITYNALDNTLEGINIHQSPEMIYMTILFFSVWAIPLMITLISEGLIAKFFHLKKIWKILLMNVFTNFCLFLFMGILQNYYVSYLTTLVIGEILVYCVEYLILAYWFYRYKYWSNSNTPKITILKYTVAANTTSLVLTLLCNAFYNHIYLLPH